MNAPSTLAAAAFAAGVATLAAAQPVSIGNPARHFDFVQEPVASASKQDDRAQQIVAAMNADPSLKDSKITVQPGDDGTITLTGATMTAGQAKRAGEIAAGANGDGKVINTILPSELTAAPR